MKGQLSAEMLILIVVVLAVVAIVATQMINTAQKGSEKIESQSNSILEKTEVVVKAKKGDFCVEPKDCATNNCFANSCD